MSRLCLDACTIIYLVEAASPFHDLVKKRLLAHQAGPDAVLLTSRLSRLECRVRPLRDKNDSLLAQYDAFFGARRLDLVELTATVIERATDLRARYGFKTPDALHLASAIEAETDTFLTGESKLARCQEVKVEVLSPGETVS